MGANISDLIEDVLALRRQAAEIAMRVRRDTDLLTHTHNELAEALNTLIPTLTRSPSRPATSPSISSSTTQLAQPVRLLRIDDVGNRLGICRSQVWRMVKDKRFPKPR